MDENEEQQGNFVKIKEADLREICHSINNHLAIVIGLSSQMIKRNEKNDDLGKIERHSGKIVECIQDLKSKIKDY